MSPSPSIITPTFLAVLSSFHLFPLHAPITLWLLDAPHGKHSIQSRLNINGKLAWFTMEIVSPLTCLLTLFFNRHTLPPAPTLLLLVLYLIHYANRSTVSVLRSSGMAPSHLAPWSAAVGFNLANGYLLGSYLSTSPAGPSHLAFSNPIYWLGVGMWVVGWVGNVLHDEILLDLRRRSPGDAKNGRGGEISSTVPATETTKARTYYLPSRLGFKYVLFPHYLSEMLEWTGWALACSSPLLLHTLHQHSHSSIGSAFLQPGAAVTWQGKSYPLLTPAWVFALNIAATLVPRAVSGRRWYVGKFGEEKDGSGRKAIVPGLL